MTTCRHCLREIQLVEHPRFKTQEWADETRDPFYCPKAINFSHKPAVANAVVS